MKKAPRPLATRIVSGLTALAALATAIVAKVDPTSCLLRGAVAYFVGAVLANLWCSLFQTGEVMGTPTRKVGASEAAKPDKAGSAKAA